MNENNSNEVVFVVDKNMKITSRFKGNMESTEFNIPYSANGCIVVHNHPKNSSFSTRDLNIFLSDDNVKSLSIVNYKNYGN